MQFLNGNDLISSLDRQQVFGEVISHAISSPLSVIQNTNQAADKEQAVNYIKEILRDFKGKEKELFSYQQTVVKINQQLDILIDTDRVLRKFEANNQVSIYGKQALLIEAIICLVKNALAANHKTVVGLNTHFDKSELKIVISDFGNGMTYWQQRLAMMPFISNFEGGKGIGLPFAYWVVNKKFRGSFQMLSKRGMGTMVVLKIPVVTLS